MDSEAQLTALHEIATTIQSAETATDAAEQTVAAAANILDFYMCSVEIHEDGWLIPYAVSEDSPEDGVRRMRVDQGLAGKTFQTEEPHVIDHVTSDDETDPADETYRSGLSVPIGGHGVFQAVSTEPEAFDEQDVELAELLVSHTAGALDRLEREAMLEDKNKQLESFASIVSHDLRSPLSVATSRIELAESECESEHLSHALNALGQMETLIDDILTLSKQGEVIADPAPVSLATVATEAWDLVATRQATLEVVTDDTIRADRDRLKQLFVNLFRNSVEHAGDTVTVTVGQREPSGFYVADDGVGIPDDQRERLFEHGYSTTDEGTGLGLRIVEQIAGAHGWTVRLTESQAGGARFEFSTGEPPSET
ncbi:GAF domain-containing sensor histidine kinase [Halovenus sp. HT40]|uniref:GAF domain-containing sensor histidine kinase n=1 Tax=Halovenus sp. HT40 TaxID=3126691 RepID=UPI00300EF7B1